MTQLFNITVDGVAKEISTCTISEEMNRFYDVATFQIDEIIQHERDVVINYGDKTFNGFVYSTKKLSNLLYSVECRTYGAKLTEPYSAYTEGFDSAETSHELCSLYATQSGVPINITSEDITFGGSYERTGTMLSALQNIAYVTGAEYWDDGSTIQIQPNKAITTTGTEIPPSDIFDFVASKSTVYNKGVGFITIQNGGSETSDIISRNRIYGEIDECSGEIFVYPNPYGALEHTVGLSELSALTVNRQETNSMLDNDTVTLDGAIDSVTEVTLNGTPITDYNFEQGFNTIYFNTLKRGTLTVTYTANAYHGYTNVSDTPIGRFITFDVFYLDQLMRFEGILLEGCLNTATDGDMICIVPSDRYYNQGFTVWTIGGDPEFIFYNDSDIIIRSVDTTDEDYTQVESVTLESTLTGYRYKTRYPIKSVLDVQSSGDDIPYSTEVDGDDYYLTFTQYYPDIKVSYLTDAKSHYVKFAEIANGTVTMVIKNKNTSEVCEYLLEYKIPCEWYQYIKVDIADELGVEVSDIRGDVLNYVKPDNTSGTVSVNNFGVVKIYVFMDGDYIIDTGSIKPRTSVTLTSNVNG